jgi:hypothetical protein
VTELAIGIDFIKGIDQDGFLTIAVIIPFLKLLMRD